MIFVGYAKSTRSMSKSCLTSKHFLPFCRWYPPSRANFVRRLRILKSLRHCFPAVQSLEPPKFEQCKSSGNSRRILAESTRARSDSYLLMMKQFSMSLFEQLYHKTGNVPWELEVELSGIPMHRRNMTNVDSKARF